MLIGLTGKAGSGKDTVGEILRAEHGFVLMSFAYPIKQMICGLLGVPMEQWNDREWREAELPIFGKSPRYLAQTIGTEWGRDCVHPDLWLNLALARRKVRERIAITDVRFDNEAKKIQDLGGTIIDVRGRPTDSAGMQHASERGLREVPWVYVVENSGTLEDLARLVSQAVNWLEEGSRDEKIQDSSARPA